MTEAPAGVYAAVEMSTRHVLSLDKSSLVARQALSTWLALAKQSLVWTLVAAMGTPTDVAFAFHVTTMVSCATVISAKRSLKKLESW